MKFWLKAAALLQHIIFFGTSSSDYTTSGAYILGITKAKQGWNVANKLILFSCQQLHTVLVSLVGRYNYV